MAGVACHFFCAFAAVQSLTFGVSSFVGLVRKHAETRAPLDEAVWDVGRAQFVGIVGIVGLPDGAILRMECRRRGGDFGWLGPDWTKALRIEL